VKVVFRKAALRSAATAAEWALGLGGVVTLAYCGMWVADGWMYQKAQHRHLQELIEAQVPAGAPVRNVSIAVAPDGLVGNVEIARLGVSVMVAEGVDGRTLRRAAGHIPGTALPGQPGNVGISGHRDTFFRPLRNIRRDDVVTMSTAWGEYRYRVVSTRIVSPRDVSVLAAGATETLTLITCYPFYFVGPAPSRFIVRAERVL
jgi:sortase A